MTQIKGIDAGPDKLISVQQWEAQP